MNKTDSKEKNQFEFVYQSGQRLDQVHNQKNSHFLSRLRKKWAGAAIVALASSTVLLFSTHNAKADVQKPNDDQQPDPVTQKTGEQTGQTLQAVQRKEDAVPADLQKQAQSDEVALNNAARQADKTVVAENKNTAAVTTQENNSTVANQSTDAKKNTDVQQTQQQAETKVATNDTTTVANKQTKNQNQINTGNKNSNTQSPVKNPVDDGQTEDQAGQKDANGVELPANNQDHVKGDVQSAWNQGYKGEHIVIAVIDSGVDVNHKDFLTMPKDPKLTATQMKRLIKKLGYGRYVNEKFPFVYNYADNEDDHMKAPDSEPHGQHVSGIIAADGHPDGDKEYVVGVAPEAQLMQLKVFGDNSTSLDMAKEIYDAVNLGADVITMSLGGGVSAADLNIQDQRAVQYAVDHGVVVTIAASNNGNSASVDDPTNLTDLSNYESGGNAGNYDPFSSSTVADPGAARSAITVAAETSGTGKNSDMAFFSSWGPLPDYTLKPDIAAPGYDVISTANDNGYTEMSGTSMATPFVAGSAALVKERLAKTNPRLRGAALVAAIKALLMNTAHPQVQNGYTTLVSPRRQGAGQIDVGAATASPVYITTPDGTGALSLRQVGNSTNFVLTLHNLSRQMQEYNFDDYGGGYTEVRNKANGIFHDVQLAGARVNGANTIILKPNETKKVTYTLNLTNLKANQLVEGYLRFTNTKDKSTLVVPYLSYYGDMTKENVFDQNANDPHPDIQGDRLANEDNYPRGIADEDSLKELVNVDGNYNWQEVAKLYESGKVAFSPNGDHKSDLIKPYAYLKQNIKDLKVEILDGSGKVVRVLTDSRGVEKSYHSDGDGATVDLGYGATNPDAFDWDGKLYDVKTGKMVTAPDGNYTYRFIATLYNNGPEKVQTNDTPVIIDTTAPVLENVHYNRRTHTISGNYSDKGAGFTDYSYATITINDQVFGFKLDDGKNSAFDDAAKTKGHFSFKLNKDQLAALTSADNLVSVAFSDVADNTAVKTLKLDGTFDEPGVSIWNATNGLPFNENSADYNKQNNTFTLRGSASDDFYLNGKWVQVDDNGQFVVPVDALGEQNLVFSSDDAGKNVLTTFRNYTLKAKFAWQHVDGQEEHFGPAIYSIFGSDPNDIVVQAAVTKGNNVKAFAKDYFTGTVYTGVVKDGIATFHVKTSINQDPNTKIYARALLQGWTEIDGPTYNDKQVTDPTSINDANYIGIYYDKNAKTKTYTNRDDLGVTMTDEAADPSDFGPGYYPGYSAPSAHNPDIKFDYLDDNNEANVGADAIQKGYYNPRTHLFTLTGQVDDKVISLTFLAASPYEEATDNQADISNDGKFSVSFKIPSTGTRELSYLYMTNDGKITRGSLTIVLDTVLPTLKVDQVPAGQNEVEITTSNPDFVLSGVANDNLDSYAVTIDGDNVFTQFGNSGYDFIPGLYPKGQKTPNTYGPYKFKVNEALDDENGKPTTHVYTIDVVDGVGNKVEKKIVVYYDPSYKPEVSQPTAPAAGNNKASQPTQATTPVQPSVPAPVAKPTKPAQKTVPVAPTKPNDQQSTPAQPTQPAPATKPNNEQSKTTPVQPTKPNTGVKTPTKPVQPTAPTTVGKTENNGKTQPAQPTASAKPVGQQSSPAQPVQKTNPAAPAKPDTGAKAPTQPAQTSKSEDNKQATPTQPAKPVAKGNNDQTGRTNNQGQLPENKNNQTQTAVPVQTVTNTDPVLPAQNGETTAASNDSNQAAVGNNNSEGQGTVVNKSTNKAVAAPVKAQKVPAVKRIKLYRNTYAYQLNGKLVRKLGKKVLYKKGQVFTLKNKGKVVKIKGQAYYQVGKNTYIKVSATLKGRQLKRLINVYDKNGKKKGQIKAGQKVKLLKNGKVTVIHGQKFYQIGKNSFVKVADFR